MRLYEVNTDTYITDRAQIVDRLVLAAARLLTFSVSAGYEGLDLPPKAAELLAVASVGRGTRANRGLYLTVQMLWRAWVQADVKAAS
jgi:hypothetical protein